MSDTAPPGTLIEALQQRWPHSRSSVRDRCTMVECRPQDLAELCAWLCEQGHALASLIVEELADSWLLHYLLYSDQTPAWVEVRLQQPSARSTFPSISARVHAADWHEREAEDLFNLVFEGHPRLGDFVLHNEDWPEAVAPMRRSFDVAAPRRQRQADDAWRPLRLLKAPGNYMMTVGPIYSGVAESTHFLLETTGEEVVRAVPRLFYKYRAVEKLAEGKPVDEGLLLAERFAGTASFAHSLAFCQVVEAIVGLDPHPRVQALRTLLAELERLRSHTATVQRICEATGLAVAANLFAILEEELLRLSGHVTGHRYLYGLNLPGGLAREFDDDAMAALVRRCQEVLQGLRDLQESLYFSSDFLDRLEGVGVVTLDQARDHGLVGPVARGSGLARDLRQLQPYAGYRDLAFVVPSETQGDGYARLRVLLVEAAASVRIMEQVVAELPAGSALAPEWQPRAGAAVGWVEAPAGAAFHWLRLDSEGRVLRYRLTPPGFTNWHGFHLAVEAFTFQDFPIIMATFGLSVAECDR